MGLQSTSVQNGADRLKSALEGIEKSVLGCILMEPSRATDVVLAAYMFPTWGKVAEKVFAEIDVTGTVDTQTIAFECSRAGICDKNDIYNLFANALPSQFENHSMKLHEEWIRQQEIDIHYEAVSRLESGEDVSAVLSHAEAERETAHGNGQDENESRARKAGNFLDTLHKLQRGEMEVGYKVGPAAVSNLTMGLGLPNRYRIWGARPGMGKTTFVLQQAIEAAAAGCPTVIASLEMTFAQMLEVAVEQRTGLSRERMNTPNALEPYELKEIEKAVAWFYELPLYIEDQFTEWATVKNKFRHYVKKYGVKLFIIDYLQLLTDRSQNWRGQKHLMVEHISKGIADFARIENRDVIALSQLSRAVETRGGDKRPQLSDLRDSGAIEQDAGQIAFLYRPEYYSILEDAEGVTLKGVLEFIQVKDRYVRKTGDARIYYNPLHNKYQNEPHESDHSDTDPAPTYNANIRPSKRNDDEDIPF